MGKRNLNTGALSLENLKAKPVRTACLVVVAAVLAFTLFGGSLLVLNLRRGLSAMTGRFGADLMVVPRGAGEKAQSLLLGGGGSYFYFDSAVTDSIAGAEGVACASPQFFLTSLSADCCDDLVQLIAYDPATDFVIRPWIAEKYSAAVGDGQVVTGSNILFRENGSVKLFNHEYPVAARLSSSASGLDSSIYMTMNTMRGLIEQARAENYHFLADSYRDAAISAVLVKADPAKNTAALAQAIGREHEGVEVLVSQEIFSRISGAIAGLVRYARALSLVLWALALIVMAAVFSGSVHERKKEFALLRVFGATRRKLAGIVLGEAAIAAFAGGAAGIVLACLAIFPFSALIGEGLELPYLDAPLTSIVPLVFGSLFLSVLAGPLASLYAALRIGRAELYFTMREGE
jgi:putative ABC transport system permease protein